MLPVWLLLRRSRRTRPIRYTRLSSGILRSRNTCARQRRSKSASWKWAQSCKNSGFKTLKSGSNSRKSLKKWRRRALRKNTGRFKTRLVTLIRIDLIWLTSTGWAIKCELSKLRSVVKDLVGHQLVGRLRLHQKKLQREICKCKPDKGEFLLSMFS